MYAHRQQRLTAVGFALAVWLGTSLSSALAQVSTSVSETAYYVQSPPTPSPLAAGADVAPARTSEPLPGYYYYPAPALANPSPGYYYYPSPGIARPAPGRYEFAKAPLPTRTISRRARPTSLPEVDDAARATRARAEFLRSPVRRTGQERDVDYRYKS